MLSAIRDFTREKGFREAGRDVCIEDDQFQTISQQADVCLRDTLRSWPTLGSGVRGRESDRLVVQRFARQDGYRHG